MRLNVSPEAQRDLQGIKAYIAVDLDNPDAAAGTVADILKTIRRLSAFPDSGTSLSSVLDLRTDYRFAVCGNYRVFYRYENEELYVIRVLYARRNYVEVLLGETDSETSGMQEADKK